MHAFYQLHWSKSWDMFVKESEKDSINCYLKSTTCLGSAPDPGDLVYISNQSDVTLHLPDMGQRNAADTTHISDLLGEVEHGEGIHSGLVLLEVGEE